MHGITKILICTRGKVKQDLNGWLGVIHGPLAQLQDSKNAIKQYADQMNKDSKKFQTIVLSYPNIENDSSTNDSNRFPLTGTIDEVGRDIQQIKDMGVDHIVFGYNFVPIGRDVDKTISFSKNFQNLLDRASKHTIVVYYRLRYLAQQFP